jgi:peptide/nickel transport system ATP-binding protein
MSAPDLLDLDGVTVTFGGGIRKAPFVALEDLSLSIPSQTPEIIAVAGESGSGKTTLGRVILGLTKPVRGRVSFDGADIWATSAVHSRSYLRNVQAVFQDPFSVFNPFYPVEHLLRAPLRMFGIAHGRAEQDERITTALRQVGLKPEQVVGRYPHQLSGGQRQRLTVARCLLLKPRLIVADEPVSMIDASLRATILDALRKLKEEHGISLIYITHDLATAYQISERMEILYRGQSVERGDATAIIQAPSHPYTQLLIDSIPVADPEQTWDNEVEIPTDEAGGSGDRKGCLFRWRCPHAMDICAGDRPPFHAVGANRQSACYLYQNQSTLVLEE